MAATKKQIESVTIEKLVYGGDGLAHHDGRTVFVPFVLPEERIAATIVEDKKKFVRAQLEKVLDASPHRVAPRCPHFGVCGGCNYQQISYEQQLRFKSEILRETLRRIGGMEYPGNITLHSTQPWGYRNRAQWKIRAAGDATSLAEAGAKGTANLGIGYFHANSTTLCAVETCPILSPLLLKTLLPLRDALAMGALPPQLREIEAFANDDSGASNANLLLTVTFAGFPSRAAELAEKFRRIVPEIASLLFHDPGRERMELFGPGFIEIETRGVKYRVGHFSFFQVNSFLTGEMVQEVAENDAGGRLALDLFAGVGLFSVPLAKRFEHVVAVEANPAAARDLEANVRGHGTIEVRTSDVERFLDRCKDKPELIVLDPPRGGMSPGAVARLGRLAPERITYVSCEPPTLARDLKGLRHAGYAISEVLLFDLFPQTFHMEAIVRLERSK